ncbi:MULTISPECIES: GIY-YIG nuclease family protein [Bacillaceae]|uniref:GIY-YIG nuclease family protein n=2 Tax=Bacteria TaxID=2 RepID=UPI000BFC964E|nr:MULTISPECIES: GIY-YIG nuclease family protein [Bacillaceae]PGW22247.1 hypothetical protein COD88_28155 [Bacillus cereus]TNO91084.1 hypothetical protein FHR08_12045 [Bacillus cereus]
MQYIYAIRNKIDEKFYVGRTVNLRIRWNTHIQLLKSNKHHIIHLQRTWNKHGEESFEFNLIDIIDTGNKYEDLQLAVEMEQLFIDQYKPNKILYNRSWSSKTENLRGDQHHFYGKPPSG